MLYKSISIVPEFLQIDHDRITNLVTVNKVTCTTEPDGQSTATLLYEGKDVQTQRSISAYLSNKQPARNYLVYHIVGHGETTRRLLYVISFYRYCKTSTFSSPLNKSYNICGMHSVDAATCPTAIAEDEKLHMRQGNERKEERITTECLGEKS